MYPGIVPALTVLSMSMALPEQPASRPLPVLERASTLLEMVSVELDERALQGARYDPLSAMITLPAGSLERGDLERLTSSQEVGFVIWSDQDMVQVGLSTFDVEPYIWKRTSLVLGRPRHNERQAHPRQQWLGSVACMEEVPELKFPQIDNAWEELCMGKGRFVAEDLDAWLVRLRDHESRAWGELLKAAQLDEDALEPDNLEQFKELSSTYRRHAALHHALMWANRQQLERALDRLDEARMMGRRYDVRAGVMTSRRIEQLGHAWLLRAWMELAQRGDLEHMVELYDLYPHWAVRQPAWIKRQLALAMRRRGRAHEALALYQEILPEVVPGWVIHGEYATTYLEAHDAFRARAIQLWSREQLRQERAVVAQGDEVFTALVQRAEAGGRCLNGVWGAVACHALPWPEEGSHQDVLFAGGVSIKRWGEPHWSHRVSSVQEPD